MNILYLLMIIHHIVTILTELSFLLVVRSFITLPAKNALSLSHKFQFST